MMISATLVMGAFAHAPAAQAAPPPDRTMVRAQLGGSSPSPQSDPNGCNLMEQDLSVWPSVAGAQTMRSAAENTRSVQRRSSGTLAGFTRSKYSMWVQPIVVSGGLTGLSATGVGKASYTASGLATCGTATGRGAQATSSAEFDTTQPVGRAGWLTVGITNTEPATGSARLLVLVYRSDGTQYGSMVERQAKTWAGARVHLPAGGRVRIMGKGASYAQGTVTQTGTVEKPWGFRVSGSVAVSGAAVGAQAGKAKARKAVVLPAEFSCATGKAKVRVTRYGKRAAQGVQFRVNGKKTRHLWQPKAKTFTLKVPQRGAVRIRATVTMNRGKKPSTSRSYVACR